jgi:hypothetical protein
MHSIALPWISATQLRGVHSMLGGVEAVDEDFAEWPGDRQERVADADLLPDNDLRNGNVHVRRVDHFHV